MTVYECTSTGCRVMSGTSQCEEIETKGHGGLLESSQGFAGISDVTRSGR